MNLGAIQVMNATDPLHKEAPERNGAEAIRPVRRGTALLIPGSLACQSDSH